MKATKLIAVALLAGCASFGAKIDSWQGRNADDLIYSWGPPSDTQTMTDGRRILSYSHAHNIQGTSYDCKVWFFVGNDGKITKANGEGQLGGCNRMLGNKPTAGE